VYKTKYPSSCVYTVMSACISSSLPASASSGRVVSSSSGAGSVVKTTVTSSQVGQPRASTVTYEYHDDYAAGSNAGTGISSGSTALTGGKVTKTTVTKVSQPGKSITRTVPAQDAPPSTIASLPCASPQSASRIVSSQTRRINLSESASFGTMLSERRSVRSRSLSPRTRSRTSEEKAVTSATSTHLYTTRSNSKGAQLQSPSHEANRAPLSTSRVSTLGPAVSELDSQGPKVTRVTTRYATSSSSAAAAPQSQRRARDSPLQQRPNLRSEYRSASGRSYSPAQARVRPKSVECRVIYMHHGRCWNFNLPPECSVNDAIASATEQALQTVASQDRRLGEKLAISVHPSSTETCTVGEWAQRNLEQSPVIIIRNQPDDAFSSQKPEFDLQNLQRMMEEQTRLLFTLQKNVNEQTAIIHNQASFINELQKRDTQQADLLNVTVKRMESDLASVKGHLLGLEELVTKAGDENKRSRP